MAEQNGATLSMGQYLFRRIASLGVEHVFGVPGDFNLTLLDEIYKTPPLKWLGACNELNAAYAADGYARIKGTPAALVTTYAVGELSAMNGVAGAYAEHAGMIHIVGMTSRPLQKARALMHHTMEPGMDHAIYIKMAEPVRKTHAFLIDDATMAEEIDRVITEGVKSRLPVYIYIPTDVVGVQLDARRLETPLDLTVKNDREAEDQVVQKVLQLIKSAKKPAILADVLTIRHGGKSLTRKLVDLTHFPSYSTPLSKCVIDETSPYYNGLYNGTVSFPGVAEAVESSDLVLNIGPLLSDSNTGGFTRNIPADHLVILGHAFCQIHDQKFDGVHFLPVLQRIVDELSKSTAHYDLPRRQDFWAKIEPPLLNDSKSGPITQSYIWQRLGRFLRPNDILLAEAGTAQFGIPDATFPPNTHYITQTFWSSIGYTVGSCLGALVAARELTTQKSEDKVGRVVLLVGDGSLQMTVQEIGSYIRFGFTPTIFVINNNGYAIERAIHGPEQQYNEISPLWDYQKMLGFFGAKDGKNYSAKTVEELEGILKDEVFGDGKHIQMCEVFMDTFDYPWRLSTQIDISRKKMAQQMKAQPAVSG